MKSEEPKAINPNNFFIEILKEGEKFPNEISYFDNQNNQNNQNKDFSNIQLKIILDKMLNLKDKNFLTIHKISESNLKYFFESDLTKQFKNVYVCSEKKFDFSAYINKIFNSKSFLLVMENDFSLNFFNGNKELHISLDNYDSFIVCREFVSKIIGSGYIQSLEFVFKDNEADIYFEDLENILLGEANKNCVTQLILHNRLADFKKENLENFVNKILLNHQSLRVLKLIGFELSVNQYNLPDDEQANDENNNNNNNNNNQNLNREAELTFDFDVENILAKNKKIKILSVAHDIKVNHANVIDFFEKFYICKTQELEYEVLACRYLATIRKSFLPAADFFQKVNRNLRKYLVKFFPVKSFEIKSDFANIIVNYVDKDDIKVLPDYVIGKIEKIGFDRSNIKDLRMEYFLGEVLGKHIN
jgi:hypothetical protein